MVYDVTLLFVVKASIVEYIISIPCTAWNRLYKYGNNK